MNKVTERAELLRHMAQELCARMYEQKRLLACSSQNYSTLWNPEFQKVKQKLEKSFPDVPEMSKVSGFEIISQPAAATIVIEELSSFANLLRDIADFVALTESIIYSTPLQLNDLKLTLNRNIALLLLNLIRSLIQCLMLLASITEKRAIVGLLNACCCWKDAIMMPGISE